MTKLMRTNPSHIDYGDFKGLITNNPNFVPSNVDGIAERNGRFLVMEWKRPGEKISTGQKMLLQALAKIPDRFTVIIINGNTDEETVINSFWLLTIEGKPYKRGAGLESFKTFYKEWYKWVNDEK
jgi:hypothetical protein